MVKTQLRGVRIEGDTPLNASPGQPQICLDFLLGKGYPPITQETFYIQIYPFRATLPFVPETTNIPFRLLALLLVGSFLNKK